MAGKLGESCHGKSQACFHTSIDSQGRMMRCDQELEETVQKTQHNVSSLLERQDESLCFEPVGCSSSGLGFMMWIFLKQSWGWRSDRGREDGTREVFTKGYLRGLGWCPLACEWAHCFAEEAGNAGDFFLVPDPLRSLPSCLLDTSQSLALRCQWVTRSPRNYL